MTEDSTSRPLGAQRLERALKLYEKLDADRAKATPSPYGDAVSSASRRYYPMGEDMTYAYNNDDPTEYLMDDRQKRAWKILDADRHLTHFRASDIDFEKVDRLENVEYVHELCAKFHFHIEAYRNGVAFVHWTAYPDGRYFADEDGFGAESNSEVNIYAYIDRDGRPVIPFQPMSGEEKKVLRQKAEEIVQKRGAV